ncbi:hypothetical protein HPB49_005434 [Dermacentor silvarum]|uniref:Uncharacterized protein n=1 Tax=Dermacentor silvarum TaxID=543639 RepID=A0ACB8D2Y1_DERSI|nr:hypothetical protein HPB49_005434 [Dermacentor silvarum]
MVNQTQRIVATVRSTFRHSLESSSWLTGKVREGAIGKLDNITFYVGNPIKQFDLAFVEELYRPYPDAPLDKLFPTWIKALSLSTHHLWSDHTTWIYDETEVNAFYARADKYVVIPTGIMQRPFFYTNGPLGLNYGGLGTLLVKARQEVLNGTLDSENLADFVGTMTAYAAFASLSSTRNNVTLAGLDMSPERLFFVNSCVKLCSQYGTLPALYASHRSRCIVPLMNMPEFSKAYGCAAGAPMNPRDKCTFW